MKIKDTYLLLLICCVAVFVAGCVATPVSVPDAERKSDTAVETDGSWERIKEKGKLVIGVTDATVPMVFANEKGELTGFDVDLAKATAEKLNLAVEFKRIPSNQLTEQLNNGSVDLLWSGIAITPELTDQVLFTKPYLENKQVIITLISSGIQKFNDLSDKKVGVQRDSLGEKALKQDTGLMQRIGENNVRRYATGGAAIADLEAGRIQGVVLDEVLCRYYQEKRPELFYVLQEHFGDTSFGIAARKQEKAFVVELQKALDDLKKQGVASALSGKWFGEDVVK